MNLKPQIEARADSVPPANTENKKAANIRRFPFCSYKAIILRLQNPLRRHRKESRAIPHDAQA